MIQQSGRIVFFCPVSMPLVLVIDKSSVSDFTFDLYRSVRPWKINKFGNTDTYLRYGTAVAAPYPTSTAQSLVPQQRVFFLTAYREIESKESQRGISLLYVGRHIVVVRGHGVETETVRKTPGCVDIFHDSRPQISCIGCKRYGSSPVVHQIKRGVFATSGNNVGFDFIVEAHFLCVSPDRRDRQ